ncbi:PC-Esterase [Dillenia turbinata]|uniref:PC-Esterase n=1 Tax=Dillenia turbinata TaxID=194707 RepID=A0AAN8W117_9MAGN
MAKKHPWVFKSRFYVLIAVVTVVVIVAVQCHRNARRAQRKEARLCRRFKWGPFNSSDAIYKEVEVPCSYEMALQTWSNWLEIHVNRTKTKLYFMSMSPTHERCSKL